MCFSNGDGSFCGDSLTKFIHKIITYVVNKMLVLIVNKCFYEPAKHQVSERRKEFETLKIDV